MTLLISCARHYLAFVVMIVIYLLEYLHVVLFFTALHLTAAHWLFQRFIFYIKPYEQFKDIIYFYSLCTLLTILMYWSGIVTAGLLLVPEYFHSTALVLLLQWRM